jgi:hypothetical protein
MVDLFFRLEAILPVLGRFDDLSHLPPGSDSHRRWNAGTVFRVYELKFISNASYAVGG